MFHRRRQLTAKEKEANVRAKEARLQSSMTCQCCGRKILANKGVIAHHGYERPYEGWQTESCMGARELPFEASRSTLGVLINSLKAYKVRLEQGYQDIVDEKHDIKLTYQVYENRKPVDKFIMVNRFTWDDIKLQNQHVFIRHSWYTFDSIKESKLYSQKLKIESITRDIEQQQRRYENWVQTHKYFDRLDEKWIKVD